MLAQPHIGPECYFLSRLLEHLLNRYFYIAFARFETVAGQKPGRPFRHSVRLIATERKNYLAGSYQQRSRGRPHSGVLS
jgi:hypothetical protein